ncbi:MAG TPA: rhomboid family intramembrane serine protease [Polyangiaceae bacterium]|nr:rhomboid family intramembrane serine protease [Polyangiaceae bacterium]
MESPSFAEVEGPPERPEESFIGPLFDGVQAREWALVLQSQSIAYVMRNVGNGWILLVPPHEYERALDAIALYEEENENWPPAPLKDTPRHAPTPIVAIAFFLSVLFFLYVTGPVSSASAWFVRGRADALLLFSEPWRAVTALTLHADARHVLGNALSGTIFGTMVARRLGPGGALLAIVVAGALGNLANLFYFWPDAHRTIGASTAVFAAVGILAAVQTVLDWGRRHERRRYGFMDMLAPLIGGLALLGSLGAGRDSDLTAHGFGFAAGLVVGIAAALVVRRRDHAPSRLTQFLAGGAALLLVGGSWLLASL